MPRWFSWFAFILLTLALPKASAQVSSPFVSEPPPSLRPAPSRPLKRETPKIQPPGANSTPREAASAVPAPVQAPAPQDNQAKGEEAFRQAFVAYASQNYAEARKFYEACAAIGNAECMYWLGRLSADGQGTDRDYKEAETWYKKSAAGGYANALYGIALLYLKGGPRLKKDCAAAREWIAQAVKHGVGAQAECQE